MAVAGQRQKALSASVKIAPPWTGSVAIERILRQHQSRWWLLPRLRRLRFCMPHRPWLMWSSFPHRRRRHLSARSLIREPAHCATPRTSARRFSEEAAHALGVISRPPGTRWVSASRSRCGIEPVLGRGLDQAFFIRPQARRSARRQALLARRRTGFLHESASTTDFQIMPHVGSFRPSTGSAVMAIAFARALGDQPRQQNPQDPPSSECGPRRGRRDWMNLAPPRAAEHDVAARRQVGASGPPPRH